MYTTWEAERRLRESWRARGTSTLFVPPPIEPVSLELFGTHAHVNTEDDFQNQLLYISAARQWIEDYTNRALITQTWRYTMDGPPACAASILLPRAPLVSVTTITSYNASDVAAVMLNTTYYVDLVREPGRIYLNDGIAWPSDLRYFDALVVEYVAGYGDAEDDVPLQLRQAICLLAAQWYSDREAGDVPPAVRSLADRYRLMVE